MEEQQQKKTIPYISKQSLHKYVSRVMSQKVFNILSSINRKTESRHTAEWSRCSTICYTMAVASTHFLPFIKANEYHRKKQEVSENDAELWHLVEKAYTKIYNKHVSVVPVLPNLITGTDKTTMFVTPTKIYDREKVYLVARPSMIKNEKVDSGKCNNYSTEEAEDAQCRGIRIVLNTTFTAGGLVAPIFVIVYGLTSNEMPYNELVCVPIPGLTVGGERNLYSKKEGYIVFVTGNYAGSNNDDSNNDTDTEKHTYSKESRVAGLYRKLVYHSFIRDIRMTQYEWDGNGPVPDYLRVISWMNGAHGQMTLITSEHNLKVEEELLITSAKHSAARTGQEQSADLGPNFNNIKKDFKAREVQHQNLNPLVKFVRETLKSLESDDNGNKDVVRLASHKKKQ